MIDNLRDGLLEWYRVNGRSLPWRETKDPYKVWLSEIILQQTRVNQGLPYYLKFVNNYPNVRSLASANEQQVLNDWQGLGYYSRARNLHAAAKQVVNEFNGQFPSTYEDIITLKGVGEYTAAAISSIAFNEPRAVLDGNVFRVLARVFNMHEDIAASASRKIFQAKADEFLDKANPAQFNQAIMDFGALQCTPKSPACITCPLNMLCEGLEKGKVNQLPVKTKKVKRRTRYFHFFREEGKTTIYLRTRSLKDIWQGLMELPLIESEDQELSKQECSTLLSVDEKPELEFSKLHKLSHQDIHARFYKVKGRLKLTGEYEEIDSESLGQKPVPRLIEEYFQAIGFSPL
ncbi:MAG: A/G-specific adenine glycosylase [Bacteroidia bacterium]